MAGIKVKVNLSIIKDIRKLTSSKYTDPIAESILDQMKDVISTGLSPIRGFGRFEAYKAQSRNRGGKKTGYPYNVQTKFPGKKVRPVNLELSGDMLDALDYKNVRDGIELSIYKKAEAEKAKTHQQGTDLVPQRRFIPSTKGEQFITSITVSIKKMFVEALDKIIRSE